MQAEHEAQRVRNAELVQLQEESTAKQEQLRRATEEQIQLARRRTEEELAEIERTTLRARAFAEAEARAHEARLSEETNRRLLLERANAEKDKWLAAINSTFTHLGSQCSPLPFSPSPCSPFSPSLATPLLPPSRWTARSPD